MQRICLYLSHSERNTPNNLRHCATARFTVLEMGWREVMGRRWKGMNEPHLSGKERGMHRFGWEQTTTCVLLIKKCGWFFGGISPLSHASSICPGSATGSLEAGSLETGSLEAGTRVFKESRGEEGA